jgi:hypothetical protein
MRKTFQRIIPKSNDIKDLDEFSRWMSEATVFRKHCAETNCKLDRIKALRAPNGDVQLKMTFIAEHGQKPVPLKREYINTLATNARAYVKATSEVEEEVEEEEQVLSDSDDDEAVTAENAFLEKLMRETEKNLRPDSEPVIDVPDMSEPEEVEREPEEIDEVESEPEEEPESEPEQDPEPEDSEPEEDEPEEDDFDIMSPEFDSHYKSMEIKRKEEQTSDPGTKTLNYGYLTLGIAGLCLSGIGFYKM